MGVWIIMNEQINTTTKTCQERVELHCHTKMSEDNV